MALAPLDRGRVAEAVEQQPTQLGLLVVLAARALAADPLRVGLVALPQPQPQQDKTVLLARDLVWHVAELEQHVV